MGHQPLTFACENNLELVTANANNLVKYYTWWVIYTSLYLRPRPHYGERIWKRSFISLVRPSIHTNLEKLFTENEAFRKRSWKQRNLKTQLCVFVWTENILKTPLFEKRWRHDNQVICRPESSSNTNPKWRLKWWLSGSLIFQKQCFCSHLAWVVKKYSKSTSFCTDFVWVVRHYAIIIRRGKETKNELCKEKYYTITPFQQRQISSNPPPPPNLPNHHLQI